MVKPTVDRIELLVGRGVAGDAHCGTEVKHRSRVAKDPTQPNLRQVHLIGVELHDRLRDEGYGVAPGEMGENVLTSGIDLLGLTTGTRLALGDDAQVEVTGLRNPCPQLDGLHPGLKGAVLDRDDRGALVRLAGVMAVVTTGGVVRPGDTVRLASVPFAGSTLVPV